MGCVTAAAAAATAAAAVPLALVATAVSNEPAAFLSFFLEGGVIGKMLRVGVWMNPLVRDFSFCACVFSVCGVAFLRSLRVYAVRMADHYNAAVKSIRAGLVEPAARYSALEIAWHR